MEISFCCTCRDRLWQLRETLGPNLEAIRPEDELVLIDFGSSDGLEEFVLSNFIVPIHQGRLKFFCAHDVPSWHAARAKNLAHRLSSRSALFSLDADNFLTKEDISHIVASLSSGSVFHQFSGDFSDGSCGRIGIKRDLFLALGGYDESLLPLGYEDIDLLNRAASLGCAITRAAPSQAAIQNDNTDREGGVPKGSGIPVSWELSEQINNAYARARLKVLGPVRTFGYTTFKGSLNGTEVIFDGLGNITPAQRDDEC